jgi:hypothetical protein
MSKLDEEIRIDDRALMIDERKADDRALTTDALTTDDLDKVTGGGTYRSYGYSRYGYGRRY